MKVKMHTGVLVLILTFLGVASQQQTTVANQELVLHFTDITTTSQEAQNTISVVKNQLQDLGVDNIQIKNKNHGKLVITYFSNLDVASIKKKLSKDKSLKLDSTGHNPDKKNQTPTDKKDVNYNLDIYEIQNANDVDLSLNGYVLKNKIEHERFYEPNIFLPVYINSARKEDGNAELSYKVWRNVETLIDNHSYIIPEVRAGPHIAGNS